MGGGADFRGLPRFLIPGVTTCSAGAGVVVIDFLGRPLFRAGVMAGGSMGDALIDFLKELGPAVNSLSRNLPPRAKFYISNVNKKLPAQTSNEAVP
jgi:hypothetical protein